MTLVEIFKQLKEARLAANRTLRDVSKACGVAEPTLSMAERGERVGMRGHNLVNWAAALDFELVLREVGPVSTSPEAGPQADAHDVRRCAAPGPDEEMTGDGCGCGCAECRDPQTIGICTCWCCSPDSVHGADGRRRAESTKDGA